MAPLVPRPSIRLQVSASGGSTGCAGRETGARSLSARLAAIEAARLDLCLTVAVLAVAAGVGSSTYRRVLLMPGTARASTVRRLEAALAALRRRERASDGEPLEALIRATYGGFAAALAGAVGIAPAAVHAQDPRTGATADKAWRAVAHVRQGAIYLTNTALGLKQRRLAHALGLTPAAVCLALRSVEDRRDDPVFDRLLDRLAVDILGAPS